MNRRELLKYFAAGTVIAPAGVAGVVGKLIEEPKLAEINIQDEIRRALVAPSTVIGARLILKTKEGERSLDVDLKGFFPAGAVSVWPGQWATVTLTAHLRDGNSPEGYHGALMFNATGRIE
jgi:hypothetical protein